LLRSRRLAIAYSSLPYTSLRRADSSTSHCIRFEPRYSMHNSADNFDGIRML
jgi:hypothetical protein